MIGRFTCDYCIKGHLKKKCLNIVNQDTFKNILESINSLSES